MLLLLLIDIVFSITPTFYFSNGNFYDGCPPVQTFQDGEKHGPCFGGQIYSSDSKYWIGTFDGEKHCGEYISMTYNNNSIILQIMDKCPGCSNGQIDMSLEALIELTGSKENACAINRLPVDVNWEYTTISPKINKIMKKEIDKTYLLSSETTAKTTPISTTISTPISTPIYMPTYDIYNNGHVSSSLNIVFNCINFIVLFNI